jgi:nucleotidyltransferase substrate binding protein (TIGR01987 family)
MELLLAKYRDAENALRTFEEVLEAEYSNFIRDAAIQRFEYTTEAVWKCLQNYLLHHEGIQSASPKTCFREAKRMGILSEIECEQALRMIDDRNLTSHTYHVEIAEKIFKNLKLYAGIMSAILKNIKGSFDSKL